MADISKIKVPINGTMTEFNIKGSGGSANYYGTCTGQAANQTKVVTISSDQGFELKTGVLIFVKFDANNTYNVTASTPISLNVNSTGAKQVYSYGTNAAAGTNTTIYGRTNYINSYVYNGTYWVWAGSSCDNNTTYSNMSISELTTGTATTSRVVRSDYLKAGVEALSTAFGTCTTAAATAAKVVTLTDSNWVLRVGAIIGVKFSYTNTASNPTLNVNGSGAKSIFRGNAVQTSGNAAGTANYIYYYQYDGTNWNFISWGIDNNTTYSPQSLGFGYGTCTTAAATVAKVVTLSGYALVINGMVSVKFTYAVPANATMNINSKGAKNIWYHGANITAGIIAAGDLATFIYDGTRYQLISIDKDETGSGGGGSSNRVYISPSTITYNSGSTLYTFVSSYITDNSLFELICNEENMDSPTNVTYNISNNRISISFNGDTRDKTFVLIAEAISISN